MTFRVALAAAALLTFAGAAQAQPQPTVDHVVVHFDGKPMPAVRSELWSAAEAVCRSDEPFASQPSSQCVSATYGAALRQVLKARAAASATPKLTTVASR